MIRVLLAEDQAMVRGALSALLSLEEDIEVVAGVARGDEVVPIALETRPDVALLDIEMPGGGGLRASQALHERLPVCRVVILTTFGRSGYLRRAMESGGGASIAGIATRLFLSEGTVRNHLSVAMQKLGARNRMEAARLAEQRGWL